MIWCVLFVVCEWSIHRNYCSVAISVGQAIKVVHIELVLVHLGTYNTSIKKSHTVEF